MIKALIVDDETLTRKSLLKHVHWMSLGISTVKDAKDGIDALEICKEYQPDIVISDIRMPGMDGIELSTQLKKMFPDCIIIFLSGYADKEYLKSAISLGALSYVEKPINFNEISTVLKKSVDILKEKLYKTEYQEQLNKALSDSIPFIKQKLVFSLISKKNDFESLQNELKHANINIDFSGDFVIILAKLEPMDEYFYAGNAAICMEVLQCFEQELKSLPNLTACKDQNHIVSILSQKNVVEKELLGDLLPQLNSAILQQFGTQCKIFLAVGKKGSGLKGIFESYQTAALTLQKLFFYGYGNIVFYQQKISQEFQFNDALEHHFLSLLKENNLDKTMAFIDKLCKDIQRNDATLANYVKNFFYKLSLILASEYKKRGLSETMKDESESSLWELMSNFKTIYEIRDYMLDRIRILLLQYKEMDFADRKVFDILTFLEKNYSDSNLTLQVIAEAVHLTPTYLCTFFKKETGKTLNEHLVTLRIEKSKEFFSNKNSKLSEVANKVGYNDVNYFSKTFKRLVGITPSEFKERISS